MGGKEGHLLSYYLFGDSPLGRNQRIMPSRKKAKGKARKAAKEAKARDEESRAVGEVGAIQRREGSLEAQLHQLVISDVAPQKCEHGLVQLSAGEEKICLEFINEYLAAFTSQKDVEVATFVMCHATKDKYADVYFSKLESVVSILLASGTQSILDGRNDIAQRYAMLAAHFGEMIAVGLRKTKSVPKTAKVLELDSADDHTLVSFYRKRITCTCLDEKYKEVKSITKMGICFNLNCSHPDRKVERSKMFSCSRCNFAKYCSVECQKAAWKTHRQNCGKIANTNAELKGRQF